MTATSKSRSPNYPTISLREAIVRTRSIYDKQRGYPTTREVLAKLLGYGSLNGASARVISALSKFGLLEGSGDKLRVSALGQELVRHQRADSEYAEAISRAAFMPVLFRDLRSQYPDGLPSEHSLQASLIQRGFNPKSVGNVIRIYRDTVKLVDEADEETDRVMHGEQTRQATPGQAKSGEGQGIAKADARLDQHLSGNWTSRATSGSKSLTYQLTAETEVQTIFRGPVTPDAVESLVKQLQLQLELNAFGKRTETQPTEGP